MKDLRCMSFTSKGTTEIIAAGLQDTMFVIDLIKGDVVKQVYTSSLLVTMGMLIAVCRYLPNTSIRS